MSEVFASINHRLAEEYQRIDLPSLDAKERCATSRISIRFSLLTFFLSSVLFGGYRLLVDACFVHEKLSALRGASALSNMLETIVQEKSVRTKSVLYPNGVANGGIAKSGTAAPVIGNNSSIPGNRTPTMPTRTNTPQSPLGTNINPNSLANRPSPFAKRGLAGLGLLGGVVSGSNTSLVSTRSGSPADSSGRGTPTTETGGGGEDRTRTQTSGPASSSASLSDTPTTGQHPEGTGHNATISVDSGEPEPSSEA